MALRPQFVEYEDSLNSVLTVEAIFKVTKSNIAGRLLIPFISC
ncbi:hypothetical protein SBF1_610021 [Candidatus Desulfosporosinus infrequens]|uniref:Uncharacterized protein n=1 Tax=Candidatus Desulfosporosinus infrequens TaxID=2043169 RepID=A0A2U3LLM9_9FIRM|nr:hypothetical protein SBF1_610021 [Candidatus Desulfosporosinus infrequens]